MVLRGSAITAARPQRPPLPRCNHLLLHDNVFGQCLRLQSGISALLWTARKGHVDALRLLLDRGADMEATNDVSLQ